VKSKTFNLAIGGYFAYKSADNSAYSITRILDIDDSAIHYSIYSEKFVEVPIWEDIKLLLPSIDHVPHAIGALLLHWNDVHLIKLAKLELKDLSSYRIYLHEMGGMSEEEIGNYFQDVINLSGKIFEMTLSREEDGSLLRKIKLID